MKHLCKSLFFCSLVSLSYMVKHFVCSKKKFANGFINKTSFFCKTLQSSVLAILPTHVKIMILTGKIEFMEFFSLVNKH